MKVIHLLAGGGIGGIETLCKDFVCYSKHENVVAILWDNGFLGNEIAKLGYRVVCLHISRTNIISAIYKVVRLCRQEKADVIVAHHASPMSHLCLLYIKKRFCHIHTIAYAHSNAEDMIRVKQPKGLWLREMILRMSLRHADHVVAISESVRKSLIERLHTPQDKITVIYNGVDVSRFDQMQVHSTSNTVNLIYVGRLIQEKGVQIILQGLNLLKSGTAYHLRVVGDGNYRTTLEALATELHVQDLVTFCGSRRDVPDLLADSDIFIHMPGWEEGFGITIVEAMAAGLICVCASSGAIPEIITDGQDGFLVEKGNAQQLADTLEKIMALPEQEKKQIRANARNRAKDFSIQRFVDQLDKVIENNNMKCDYYDYSEKQ